MALVANGFGYSVESNRPQASLAPDGRPLITVSLQGTAVLHPGLVLAEGAMAVQTLWAFVDHCCRMVPIDVTEGGLS